MSPGFGRPRGRTAELWGRLGYLVHEGVDIVQVLVVGLALFLDLELQVLNLSSQSLDLTVEVKGHSRQENHLGRDMHDLGRLSLHHSLSAVLTV
jgi:hypothetical protein